MGNELQSGDLVTWEKGAELHPNDPWVGEIESVVQFAGGLVHTLRAMLVDYDADALDALLDEH